MAIAALVYGYSSDVNVNGRVSRRGAVQVSISFGQQHAIGRGRPRGTSGDDSWRGVGTVASTDSGVLANTPYSFKTRFENEKGTNPEELIAAAHAGCFTMALAFGLQVAGFTPTELSTEAAVTLEPEGQFHISRSALTLRAKVPNLDEAAFIERVRSRNQ
jgi:osmotically inducible protein OsmC